MTNVPWYMTDDYQAAVEVQRRNARALLSLPNVEAVGVSEKRTAGKPTNVPAIVAYVREKLPRAQLRELVPARIEGRPTDVVECSLISAAGGPTFQEDVLEYTRIRGGAKITAQDVDFGLAQSGGTLGCIVQVTSGSSTFAAGLTAHHVLSACEINFTAGTSVGQPALRSKCLGLCPPKRKIGEVFWAYKKDPNNYKVPDENKAQIGVPIDAGIFKLSPGIKWSADILDVGLNDSLDFVRDIPVAGVRDPQVNDLVVKRGKTSGPTLGVVVDVNYTKLVQMMEVNECTDQRYTKLVQQILIRASSNDQFGDIGDSGSAASLTPLPGNAFAQIELTLPADVKLAVNSEYSDMRVKVVLTVTANTGPWYLDNIRFV